jgi:hypothetical protein
MTDNSNTRDNQNTKSFQNASLHGLRRRMGGLLVLKECWVLSLRAKLLVLILLLGTTLAIICIIHPFLATTHRVASKVLVVEGWVHPHVIAFAVKEYKAGNYERVFVTGGPIEGSGGYSNDFNTEASVGADLLKQAGIPVGALQMVPSHIWNRNRTYYSAIALREWFHTHDLQVKSMNVLTEDSHARRTWLLFQKAFSNDVQVGIISVPNPDYNASHWWRYSEGFREVTSEAIAYIYAKFCFW